MLAYSTRDVASLAGIPAATIRRWARAGLLSPRKNRRGHWRFTFQDLAVLRTASRLFEAGVGTRRVRRTLALLCEQLPDGRPLSAVRIIVNGPDVLVRDRLSSWEPESGQRSLDFDPVSLAGSVAPGLPLRAGIAAGELSAEELYQEALDLELAGRAEEARETYEAVLRCDPQLVAARINLGRLLHAAGRLREAEALYRAALDQEPESAVAAFNLAVLLEDQGREGPATDAYRRVLAIDDRYADAHYNLSRLLESQGDSRGALRHLSRFRRLMKNE